MAAQGELVRALLGGGGAYFRAPVRWLLGRDLLAQASSILLYSAFGTELDHRDWMYPEVEDLSDDPDAAAAQEFWFDYLADAGDGQLAMYSVARIGQVQIMYRARLVSADVAAGPESEDVALVEWQDIPWEQLAFPTVVWALAHFHESRGKTDFATYSNPTGDLARMWPPRKPAGV